MARTQCLERIQRRFSSPTTKKMPPATRKSFPGRPPVKVDAPDDSARTPARSNKWRGFGCGAGDARHAACASCAPSGTTRERRGQQQPGGHVQRTVESFGCSGAHLRATWLRGRRPGCIGFVSVFLSTRSSNRGAKRCLPFSCRTDSCCVRIDFFSRAPNATMPVPPTTKKTIAAIEARSWVS